MNFASYLLVVNLVAMNAACDPILDVRLSQQQLKELYERNPALAKRNPVFNATPAVTESKLYFNVKEEKPRSKYGNIKVEYQGMKFDSKKELKCWKELKLFEEAGQIRDLERQVPFLLVVNGKTIGKFTADFVWQERRARDCAWVKVVADAKSPATRKETAYRLRKRIFEAQYAPLVIREL